MDQISYLAANDRKTSSPTTCGCCAKGRWCKSGAAALTIDISQQQSKRLDEFAGQTFDYVITVHTRSRGLFALTGDCGDENRR